MTPRLTDAFDRMVADEPPLGLTVDDIVAGGERRKARVRRAVGLSIAAGVLLVVGVAGVVVRAAVTGDRYGAGSVTVTAPAGSDDEPGPSPSVSSTVTTSTTTTTAPPASGAEELLGDPGFEGDPPGWATFGPATVLTPVGEGRTGDQALRVATQAGGDIVTGATDRPATTLTETGRRYRASCWVRADGPGGVGVGATVQVQEYTTGWERAGDAAPSPEVVVAEAGRWYEVAVTYTAQGTGHLLPLSVFSDDLTAGGPGLVVDDCSLVTEG